MEVINKVVVNSGDVLIFRTPCILSETNKGDLKKKLAVLFPKQKFLILDPNCGIEVISNGTH